jgi:hypothetical protein
MFTDIYITIISVSLIVLLAIVRQKHEIIALLLYYAIGVAAYFVIDAEGYNKYYILMGCTTLIVGIAIQYEFKIAAMCSYLLVFVNVIGYYLWYKHYSHDLYEVISAIILITQFLSILPKALFNGITRPNDRYSLDGATGFDGRSSYETHPKTGVAVIAAVKVNNWWVDWGSELIDQLTSIAGLILVIVLICYHFLQTKKTALENKDISNKIRIESAENNHELKEKLRKEIADEAVLIAELDDKLNNKVR